MKNNITVLLLYFENKGSAVGKPTCYWFTFFICSNRFCDLGTLVFASLHDTASLSNQHFYCE